MSPRRRASLKSAAIFLRPDLTAAAISTTPTSVVFERAVRRTCDTFCSASTTTFSKDPAALMENIQRVTAHLAAQAASEPDSSRRVLTLIPARDGRAWHVDAEDNHWRAYRFIEKARTYDAVESTDQAFQAARAFGRFQNCWPTCPRRDCTIRSPIFTIRQNASRRWRRRSQQTRQPRHAGEAGD